MNRALAKGGLQHLRDALYRETHYLIRNREYVHSVDVYREWMVGVLDGLSLSGKAEEFIW